MKWNKRTFFSIHSWIGIQFSILFFIVCFSGTIATLSNELDWLFTPGMRVSPQETLAPRNEIRDRIEEQYPGGEIVYWTSPGPAYLADIVYVVKEGVRTYVFVNPHTGLIQGDAQITIQRYFRDLHYYLFIPFQVGHFTVLLFGFLLLFAFVTALLFYKKWYKKLFQLITGKGILVFFRSLHRLVGLWSVPFAFLFAVTGIWYFIERADVGGVSKYIRYQVPKVEVTDEEKWENLTYTVDYDQAIAIAKEQIPGLKVERIGPPHSTGNPIFVYGENEVPLVRARANRVYLDPFTFDVLATQNAKEINTPTWLNDIADPLHFGYWGGLTTKFIWFFMGIGISSLVLSGIWIAVKRTIRLQAEKRTRIKGFWKYFNYVITILMFLLMFVTLILRYQVAWHVIVAVVLCWGILIAAAYYIYKVRLKPIPHPSRASRETSPAT
ncbi:MAG: PepSY domain-containing protein [Saprospiraceae bacterium]|nr:PepSY domain-containing protein [Saprospiraceae bacterium]